jgi:hypothetical protein
MNKYRSFVLFWKGKGKKTSEFAGADFNEARLEKRFRKTMETLPKNPMSKYWIKYGKRIVKAG